MAGGASRKLDTLSSWGECVTFLYAGLATPSNILEQHLTGWERRGGERGKKSGGTQQENKIKVLRC